MKSKRAHSYGQSLQNPPSAIIYLQFKVLLFIRIRALDAIYDSPSQAILPLSSAIFI